MDDRRAARTRRSRDDLPGNEQCAHKLTDGTAVHMSDPANSQKTFTDSLGAISTNIAAVSTASKAFPAGEALHGDRRHGTFARIKQKGDPSRPESAALSS